MCASITGLKDGGVASNQWAKLKARKGLTRSSDGTPTKTTPKKRKLDGADDGEAGTPIPAARKKGRKPKTALEIQCDGGARPEDEHAAIVKSEPDL